MCTKLCQPSESCVNLRSWRALGPSTSARSTEQPELQDYIEACEMLVRSTAVRCLLLLSAAVAECKLHGQWPKQALPVAPSLRPPGGSSGVFKGSFSGVEGLQKPWRTWPVRISPLRRRARGRRW